jgi:hypothetical protein
VAVPSAFTAPSATYRADSEAAFSAHYSIPPQ